MQKVDTACFEIITRCPLVCVHCSACAAPQRADTVTPAQFSVALGRLGRLQEVYLSGGEPFEHPKLGEFIALAQEWTDRVVLYSSGVVNSDKPAPISHETVREVSRLGVHRVDVSLYADNPEQHERVTATPGSWAAAVESIRRFHSASVKVGLHHAPILPHAYVLKGIAHLAKQLKVTRVHILALASQGRGALLDSSLPQEWLDEARILSVGRPDLDLVLSSRIRQQLSVNQSTERDSWNAIFVDHRGRIYPGEGKRQLIMRSASSLFDS